MLFFLQSSFTKQDWVMVFRKIKSRSFLHVLIRELNLTPKPCFQGVDMWNLMNSRYTLKGRPWNVHALKKRKKIGEKWSGLFIYHDKIQGFSAHQQPITILFRTNFFLISFFNFHVHSVWVVRNQYSKQHSKAQAAVSLIKRKKNMGTVMSHSNSF